MAIKSYREFASSVIQMPESLDLNYAIGGSFASIAYGEARTTADLDISVVLSIPDAKRLEQAVHQLGYSVSLDAILETIANKSSFNIIDGTSGYKTDIFVMAPSPLEKSIFARRRKITYDETTNASAILYSPEDVIVYKLKYFVEGQSQKHLRDIAAMLVVQGSQLDYDYVSRWANEMGALDVWNQLLSEYKQRLAPK